MEATGVEITYKNIEKLGVFDEHPESFKERPSRFIRDKCLIGLVCHIL